MTTAAVVGTGFIGPVHAEALRRLGITVRGILGSSPEKSRESAQKWGFEVAYDDYEAILQDEQVDVVHVATPNHLHLDQVRRALAAGKHVVCEKPLAMTSAESAEMLHLAAQYPHLITAVNYNIRFYPLIHHARDLVQSGAIGDVFHIRGGYVQDWLLFETDWNWRLVPEAGGGLRAIGDIGSHWMDLMHFVTGLKTTRLLADLETFVRTRRKPRQAVATFQGKGTAAPAEYDDVPITTDDYGAVLFHYDNGARGTMNVSQVSAGRKNLLSFEIAGSKGSLAWDGENPNQLWRGHRDRPNEILIKDPSLLSDSARRYADYPGGHAEGFPDTFKELYKAVYGYLDAGDWNAPKPYPTFEDGHYEMVLMDTIARSHQQQAWADVMEGKQRSNEQ